jgi:hypothetical protein
MHLFDVLILCLLVGSLGAEGTIAYLLTRRDLGAKGSVIASVVCAVLMAVGTWLAVFFAPFVFIIAVTAYLVARRLIRIGPALTVSAVILVGGIAFSIYEMAVALDRMAEPIVLESNPWNHADRSPFGPAGRRRGPGRWRTGERLRLLK